MQRHPATVITIGFIIFSLLWPGGLTAAQQSAEQPKPGAATPASPAAQADEYVDVEVPSMFGMQHYRVKKSQAQQFMEQQKTGAGAAAISASPAAAPSAPLPPGTALQLAGPQGAQPAPATPAQPAATATPAALAPAPAAAQAPQAAADNPTVPIALHLENAELSQVVGIIASELKMNYVVDPQVKGVVNINTLGELRRADLFPLLQMILRINGATAVQTGNFFRIVPLKEVQRMPLDPTFNPDAANLPPDDRMVLNIIPLKYVSAPDMTKILTPFLSEGGHLFSHDAGNILLLTDSSRSMKRLLELVGMFDSEVFSNQRARLFEIKNSQADRVAAELKEIFSAYGLSGGTAAMRFVPIARINSVLAVTANPSAYAEVEKWLQRLDQPYHESGIQNFIYKVENAKAADVANVLHQVLGGLPDQAQPGRAPAGAPQAGGGAAAAGMSIAGMGPGGMAPGGMAPTTLPANALQLPGGAANTSTIRIVPDVVNNLLVIQATAQEYEQIKQTLKELDIVPRQVMIEAKVYEVDLTGELSAGVSAFLQNRNNRDHAALPDRKLLANFVDTSLNASLGTLVGRTRELLLFLRAAEAHSQARVISAPSLLASDNLPANINVGIEIPTLTSQALVSGAQSQGSSLFTNTIQNRDTGVMLSITPRINSSGLVNLQITQEVSAPVANTSSSIQSPSISKRSVSTQAVVEDGQTIALGGIIQENHSTSKTRIPLLGDIPYLGALFGSTTTSSQRTELILLLTPTVIRDHTQAQVATAELRDKLRDLRVIIEKDEQQQAEQRQQLKAEPPPQAPPKKPE